MAKYIQFIVIVVLLNTCKENKAKYNKVSDVISHHEQVKEPEQEAPIVKTKGFLKAQKTSITYGNIKKGDTLRQAFVLYNKGTENVEIIDYTRSCNCTDITISKYNIAPKDSTIVEMIVETSNKTIGDEERVRTTLKTNGEITFCFLQTKFKITE